MLLVSNAWLSMPPQSCAKGTTPPFPRRDRHNVPKAQTSSAQGETLGIRGSDDTRFIQSPKGAILDASPSSLPTMPGVEGRPFRTLAPRCLGDRHGPQGVALGFGGACLWHLADGFRTSWWRCTLRVLFQAWCLLILAFERAGNAPCWPVMSQLGVGVWGFTLLCWSKAPFLLPDSNLGV